MNIINKDKNGNNVPVRVFKNEQGKYSIGISKKDGDKYINRYFPVEFLKDVEVENGTDIIIKNAFLTWFDWTYQDSKGTKWIIKITAFERYGEQQQIQTDPFAEFGKNIDFDALNEELEEQLPF
jgi:hypothetical protein